jgi:hypothetical protein
MTTSLSKAGSRPGEKPVGHSSESKRSVTIVVSQHLNSSSAADWTLAFEGAASRAKTTNEVNELLKTFKRVKVFKGGQCVADFTRDVSRILWKKENGVTSC